MEPTRWVEFGEYLRSLRESAGLTLRQVEEVAKVSNAYLSMLERGLRESPGADILRRLAAAYDRPVEDLMRKAGYLGDPTDAEPDDAKLEQAYVHVKSDPNFEFGTRITGPVSRETKRFIVELYERSTRRKLL